MAALLGGLLVGAALLWAGVSRLHRLPPGVVALSWPADGPGFGGWSGMDIAADGRRFWALSDAGTWTTGTLTRSGPDERLSGLHALRPQWLGTEVDGESVVFYRDSEGLDVAPDGVMHVSFEGFHRLRRFDWPGGRMRWVPPPAIAPRLGYNSGMEALARAPDGSLLTLFETDPRGPGFAALWRWNGARWDQPWTLPRDRGWSPVGADFGPDGRLYLLERGVRPLGFVTRIRAFDPGAPGLLRGQTVYQAPPGRHGNLEGIGLWRDAAGRLRAVMVADDNHLWLQRSQIVEVTLP